MPRLHDDSGSIPMALLTIIALTSVIGALVANAVANDRSARFDRSYTEVIQAADLAAQQGSQHLMRALTVSELEGRAAGYAYNGSGTADGMTYTWTATKQSTLAWEVVGSATAPAVANVPAVTREVVIDVEDRSRFSLAAFSDDSFVLRGGNAASSYNGDTHVTGTLNGIVASNATIRLNGNAYVDGVHLYNFDALPNLGRCDGKANDPGQCQDLYSPGTTGRSATIGPRLEIGPGLDLDTQFIDDHRTNSCPGALTDFIASSNGGTIGTAGSTSVLCFDNMTIDTDLTVLGDVEVYVYGDFNVSNHTDVNCPGCTDSSSPDSTNFLIYSDGGEIAIGNHSNIAAGIYAPESECAGNPSSAQGNVFGSMICQTISNQGGWGFHYDDQLGAMGSGDYTISDWREN